MGLCESLITNGINEAICDLNPVKGYESVGHLINRSDVDWSKTSVASDGTVKIELKSDAITYKIVQPKNTPFNGTGSELNVGTYMNTFNNNLSFIIIGGNEDSNNSAKEIANGDFIAVLDKKDKEGNHYEVFGYYQGLTPSEVTREEYDDDTIGGWKVTLSETGSPAPSLFMTAQNYNALVTD